MDCSTSYRPRTKMDMLERALQESIQRKEMLKRRQMRISQARQQAAKWAKDAQGNFKDVKGKEVKKLIDDLTEDAEQNLLGQIQELADYHDGGLDDIGAAHIAAANAPDYDKLMKDKELENQKKAKERGRRAMAAERGIVLPKEKVAARPESTRMPRIQRSSAKMVDERKGSGKSSVQGQKQELPGLDGIGAAHIAAANAPDPDKLVKDNGLENQKKAKKPGRRAMGAERGIGLPKENVAARPGSTRMPRIQRSSAKMIDEKKGSGKSSVQGQKQKLPGLDDIGAAHIAAANAPDPDKLMKDKELENQKKAKKPGRRAMGAERGIVLPKEKVAARPASTRMPRIQRSSTKMVDERKRGGKSSMQAQKQELADNHDGGLEDIRAANITAANAPDHDKLMKNKDLKNQKKAKEPGRRAMAAERGTGLHKGKVAARRARPKSTRMSRIQRSSAKIVDEKKRSGKSNVQGQKQELADNHDGGLDPPLHLGSSKEHDLATDHAHAHHADNDSDDDRENDREDTDYEDMHDWKSDHEDTDQADLHDWKSDQEDTDLEDMHYWKSDHEDTDQADLHDWKSDQEDTDLEDMHYWKSDHEDTDHEDLQDWKSDHEDTDLVDLHSIAAANAPDPDKLMKDKELENQKKAKEPGRRAMAAERGIGLPKEKVASRPESIPMPSIQQSSAKMVNERKRRGKSSVQGQKQELADYHDGGLDGTAAANAPDYDKLMKEKALENQKKVKEPGRRAMAAERGIGLPKEKVASRPESIPMPSIQQSSAKMVDERKRSGKSSVQGQKQELADYHDGGLDPPLHLGSSKEHDLATDHAHAHHADNDSDDDRENDREDTDYEDMHDWKSDHEDADQADLHDWKSDQEDTDLEDMHDWKSDPEDLQDRKSDHEDLQDWKSDHEDTDLVDLHSIAAANAPDPDKLMKDKELENQKKAKEPGRRAMAAERGIGLPKEKVASRPESIRMPSIQQSSAKMVDERKRRGKSSVQGQKQELADYHDGGLDPPLHLGSSKEHNLATDHAHAHHADNDSDDDRENDREDTDYEDMHDWKSDHEDTGQADLHDWKSDQEDTDLEDMHDWKSDHEDTDLVDLHSIAAANAPDYDKLMKEKELENQKKAKDPGRRAMEAERGIVLPKEKVAARPESSRMPRIQRNSAEMVDERKGSGKPSVQGQKQELADYHDGGLDGTAAANAPDYDKLMKEKALANQKKVKEPGRRAMAAERGLALSKEKVAARPESIRMPSIQRSSAKMVDERKGSGKSSVQGQKQDLADYHDGWLDGTAAADAPAVAAAAIDHEDTDLVDLHTREDDQEDLHDQEHDVQTIMTSDRQPLISLQETDQEGTGDEKMHHVGQRKSGDERLKSLPTSSRPSTNKPKDKKIETSIPKTAEASTNTRKPEDKNIETSKPISTDKGTNEVPPESTDRQPLISLTTPKSKEEIRNFMGRLLGMSSESRAALKTPSSSSTSSDQEKIKRIPENTSALARTETSSEYTDSSDQEVTPASYATSRDRTARKLRAVAESSDESTAKTETGRSGPSTGISNGGTEQTTSGSGSTQVIIHVSKHPSMKSTSGGRLPFPETVVVAHSLSATLSAVEQRQRDFIDQTETLEPSANVSGESGSSSPNQSRGSQLSTPDPTSAGASNQSKGGRGGKAAEPNKKKSKSSRKK